MDTLFGDKALRGPAAGHGVQGSASRAGPGPWTLGRAWGRAGRPRVVLGATRACKCRMPRFTLHRAGIPSRVTEVLAAPSFLQLESAFLLLLNPYTPLCNSFVNIFKFSTLPKHLPKNLVAAASITLRRHSLVQGDSCMTSGLGCIVDE